MTLPRPIPEGESQVFFLDIFLDSIGVFCKVSRVKYACIMSEKLNKIRKILKIFLWRCKNVNNGVFFSLLTWHTDTPTQLYSEECIVVLDSECKVKMVSLANFYAQIRNQLLYSSPATLVILPNQQNSYKFQYEWNLLQLIRSCALYHVSGSDFK